jgi:hypothetical protein
MFRSSIVLAVVLVASPASSLPARAAADQTSTDPSFSQIDAIVKTLSEITGLTEKHAVPYGRMSKRQLRQFLNKRIKKTLKPDEIRADELSLKMFGLVPQNFDLKKSTIDLLTEQAAAFYDYDEKKLFLLDDPDSNAAGETTTLAHELSHALADQYFNLENFMEDTPSNDDENLAHTAVVEGQASWLMIAYELKHAGQDPVPTADMLKSVADSGESSMSDYPVLKNSPLYIQQSLLFPYSQGTMFFDAVFHKLGKAAFAEVFTHPPANSSQIIHPDRYFSHEKPSEPALPKLDQQSREVTDGSMGEFDHQILLQQYLGASKATELAPHLRAGHFKIVTPKGRDPKPVLLYAAEWDSPQSTSDYFDAYRKILKAKWQHCEFTIEKPTVLAGTGDNGMFVVWRIGNVLSSVEGLRDETEWKRFQGLGGL